MKRFCENFFESAKELRNLRSLVGMAVLVALGVVLTYVSIPINENNRIGLVFLPQALMGMMYGPVAGTLAAAVGDIVGFMIKPTGPYFPGFTFTAMLSSMVYAFFYYRRKPVLWKAIVSKIITTVFLSVMLNTLWVSVLYGNPFIASLWTRLPRIAVSLPIEIIILYLVMGAVSKALAHTRLRIG